MLNLDSPTHVLLFTRGTKGDLYPFLRIGSGLKSIGCNVTLISNFCYAEYAEKEGFDFVALDDEESFDALNNKPEYHASLPSLLALYKDHIISNLVKEVQIIESTIVHKKTIIVAHSNDYLSAMLASEKINIPIYLCMLAPSYVNGFYMFEAVLQSLTLEINEIREQLGLGFIRDWKSWIFNFIKCYAFWPKWFSDEASKVLENLEYVGFLSIDEVEDKLLQNEVIGFLNDKNSKKIIITHGTSRPFDDRYFELAINSCKGSNWRLLISSPFRELLPKELPSNVIWVDFCPFHKLLPHVDLIIHHGGIGTVRESIVSFVPQLIVGQGFDRQHNGKVVESLKLGGCISPKNLSEELLREKIESLLNYPYIKYECEKYKYNIYDEDALKKFFNFILKPICPSYFSSFLQLTISSPLSINRTNSLSKEICLDEEFGRKKLDFSRQEILSKLLKSKINR